MAAPVNTAATTALELGPLPNTLLQTVDDAGTTYTVWYKFTSAITGMVGIFAFGDLTTYRPFTLIYTGPDTSPVQYIVAETKNRAVQFPVVAGTTYYIRVRKDGDVSPSNLTISGEYFAPASSVPTGSIAVNDDTAGFPLALLSSTDASELQFRQSFPAGEEGDILADGTLLVEDIAGKLSDIITVGLYDQHLNSIVSIPFTSTNGWQQSYISSNKVDKFYVGWDSDFDHFAGEPSFSTIDTDGTRSAFTMLGGSGLTGLAPNNAETILYYSGRDGAGNRPIKRWDLIGATGLSNLVANLAGYTPAGIIVLADDTLVVVYQDVSGDTLVKHYNSSGSTLHTWTFGDTGDPRLAHAIDDSTFWLWIKTNVAGINTGASIFKNIQGSDGTELVSITGHIVKAGAYVGAETASPERFSHSQSCPFWIMRGTVVVPGGTVDHSVPCPCPCDCHDGGGATGGNATPGTPGPVIPPVAPETWVPECGGGGTVHTAAEIVDDEDWTDTTPPKEPNSWLTIFEDPYPAVEPSDAETTQWGLKPLSDSERFVEARLKEVGPIERGSSDKDGRYAPARLRVVAADDDGTLRERLADARRRHLYTREARFDVCSYAGRKAGLTPTPAIQGRIVDVQPALDRQAVIEVQDVVGSQFGILNPEKMIGLVIGDEHPNLPEESRGQIYKILYGEYSDAGVVDEAGNSAAKGQVSVVDCGDTDFVTPGDPVMVSAPRNLTAEYIGDDVGSRTYHYGIVGVTNLGHTAMSNIVSVSGLPDSLDVNDYVQLNWDAPATGAAFIIAYWVMGRTASTPNKRLDTMNNDGTYVDPETSYRDGRQGSRTDFDIEKSVNFKPIATAPASNSLWTWFAVALGEVDILQVYGSDIADGVPPKRVLLDINGEDLLTPDSAGWPEANRYRVVGGIRQTGFWAKGIRVQHHRDGIVTFAVNVCGYKGINGELINQAYLMWQSFLNEMVEKNGGEGYRDGDFGPTIETFADGTPLFWTSKFQEAQDDSAALMGNALGYIGRLFVLEPTSLAEVLRRFFVTYGGHQTSDGHGRVYPYLVSPVFTPGTGQVFRERKEISRLLEHRIEWKELENRLTYSYLFDCDAQEFLIKDLLLEDADSIAAHGGVRIGVFQTSVKDCYFGNDEATMAARWALHLMLYKEAPRYVKWATNMEHFQRINGEEVRFSHRKEGIGVLGETDTPGVIQQVTFLPDAKEMQHVVRLIPVAMEEFGALQDEDTMVGNLGDELSEEPPPVGAFKLGTE